ncbi:MAG: hypothetical protein JXQ73_28640 [Phycisphaerae bacterium]|nr:hypothetical protein [Phycisphaerae bacterium]
MPGTRTRGRWAVQCVLLCLTVAGGPIAYGDSATGGKDKGKAATGTRTMTTGNNGVGSHDFFPILPWGRLHGGRKPGVDRKHGLESIAECDFTIAGFVLPSDLPRCEKLGLRAIVLPDAKAGAISRKQWSTLSDAEIDQRIKTMVERCGDSQAILGYYLIDEPGAALFPALGKAVAAVKKYAPGKLAYINLYPDYATIGAPDISQLDTDSYTEYLERFVKQAKPHILSYDNYRVQYSMDLKDAAMAASYYANLMEVRRVALKHGLPFWNIVSSNQIRPHTTIPSPANLLYQAYTTLAAGGRGVSWYTYYANGYGYAPIDESERKTLTWRYLQMVNHQIKVLGPILNTLESTGVFFTSPPPVKSLPVLPGKLVKAVKADVPVMVGEFTGPEGTAWVMLVNLSLAASARLDVKTHKDDGSVQVVSAEDTSLSPIDHKHGLWLVAGQGVLLKLVP